MRGDDSSLYGIHVIADPKTRATMGGDIRQSNHAKGTASLKRTEFKLKRGCAVPFRAIIPGRIWKRIGLDMV